ncbi:hypothetical protein TNCV_3308211 [Trichonephila clavipes]|nr:hypothetical protein TNCV_3308211 [Trichonephila clavipes]
MLPVTCSCRTNRNRVLSKQNNPLCRLDRTSKGKAGARVVGCCAHVAPVLWYLGYWRHNPTQRKTPSLGYADTLQDAATGWSSDDSASEIEKEI